MAKHLKDTDYSKTIAKIRVFEKYMLTRQTLEKMCECKQMDEIYKILSDANWHFSYGEKDPARVLSDQQQWLFTFLREVVEEEHLLKLLLLKTDYQNIKAFLKQELAGNPIRKELFLEGGTIPVNDLMKQLGQREQGNLRAEMFSAFLQAREAYMEHQDPQRIDLILDEACVGEMIQCAQAFENKFILQYLQLQMDAVNLKTLLRICKISDLPQISGQVFLKGGQIPCRKLQELLTVSPEERKAFLLSTDIGATIAGQLEEFFQEGSVTALEKGLDNLLMEQLKTVRFLSFGPEPIFAYAKYMENEIRCVRIIINGMLSGLDPQSIRERLRLTYA